MFAIKVNYLLERSYAAPPERGDEKDVAEWPPHPGRLFCALVAAWGETGEDAKGKEALEWLECLPSPSILSAEYSERKIRTVYVPVNDTNEQFTEKAGGKISFHTEYMDGIGIRRGRKERSFPSVSLAFPAVWFIWQEAQFSDEHKDALQEIFRHTTYLGHSSSLVSVEFDPNPPLEQLPPEYSLYTPADGGGMNFRVPSQGRLSYLQERYKKFAEENSVKTNRPSPGKLARYKIAGNDQSPSLKNSVFQEIIVLKRGSGDRLGILSTLQLVTALRGSLLKHSPQPVPEFISGHSLASGGEKSVRSENPHIALVPLANVGNQHSDGDLLGVGLLLPQLTSGEKQACFTTIANILQSPITMASAGVWNLASTDATERRFTLQGKRWTAPSRYWGTVTPFVFDRFPKDHHGEEARGIVSDACERMGLPRPTEVVCVQAQYAIAGVPPAAAFKPAPARPGKPQRWHIHLLLSFDEEVEGPVCIGAGRHYGYGFCAPLKSQ